MPASLRNGAARPEAAEVQVFPRDGRLGQTTPTYLVIQHGYLIGKTVSPNVAAELAKNNHGAVIFKRVLSVEADE